VHIEEVHKNESKSMVKYFRGEKKFLKAEYE
jgi:hypothetical protein